jgi:hypothetical protein
MVFQAFLDQSPGRCSGSPVISTMASSNCSFIEIFLRRWFMGENVPDRKSTASLHQYALITYRFLETSELALLLGQTTYAVVTDPS